MGIFAPKHMREVMRTTIHKTIGKNITIQPIWWRGGGWKHPELFLIMMNLPYWFCSCMTHWRFSAISRYLLIFKFFIMKNHFSQARNITSLSHGMSACKIYVKLNPLPCVVIGEESIQIDCGSIYKFNYISKFINFIICQAFDRGGCFADWKFFRK